MSSFLRPLVVAVVGAATWILALPLVPATEHRVGPATVRAGLHLGHGTTMFVTPPLGSVSADTHLPPVDLYVSLAELDVGAVRSRIARGDPVSDLAAEVEPALRDVARAVVLSYLLAGVLLGGLAGALVPRRSWRSVVIAGGGGVGAAVIALAAWISTFDERGFEEPRFTGALRSAPDVIRAVEQGTESLGELGSRYEAVAQRFARLLALTSGPIDEVGDDSVALLHISDIHSNPIGVEFARRLARAFDVDAVIDTGDLTSFGVPLESRLVRVVGSLGVPYFYVPGNHDSSAARAAIDALPNVTLLDKDPIVFLGIEILGWADPTFTAANEISTEEGNEVRLQEASVVGEAVVAHRPDVLAVHDRRLAEDAVGSVPLVLAGHTHEREVVEEEETVIVVVGSTGATGLGSFLVEAAIPYEAQIVYLDEGRLVAVDYVTFSGLGGEAKVERSLFPAAETPTPIPGSPS